MEELLFLGKSTSSNIEEFYNTCHDASGRFCPTPGGKGGAGGVSGKSKLPDNDGKVSGKSIEGVSKRGKRGASLKDPNEGTRTIDGVPGYDSRGKPVPGSSAWLEAHGIAPKIFASRPYVQYEASKTDPAVQEAFKGTPQGLRFWNQKAAQEGQTGGFIMYKHPVPGSPYGPIAPQVRPNVSVVTNPAKRAYADTVHKNDVARLESLKKATPSLVIKERREVLKQTKTHLERVKEATPEKIRAEAASNLQKATDKLATAKASGDKGKIFEAQKELVGAKRQALKETNRANNWRPDKELYNAETAVKYAENRLAKAVDNPKAALEAEIKSQTSTVKRSANRLEKTAAKYVFTPGEPSARIDMNQDAQNVRNLTEGKGRIYFAMEGSIKADALLTAAKKEDPTAAVVNVPSVTLWQQKGKGGDTEGEIKWFAENYGKGRQIILIPDADGVTNPNVMAQAKAMGSALRTFGATDVTLAAPPLKKGTRKVVDHFNLPSGIDEGRKGVDDHLGAGRGTLGQMQYTKNTKVPSYDLSQYTVAAGGTGPKMNKNAVEGTERALAAISGIAGPEGSSRMPKKMLAQAAGLAPTSAKEARDRLEKLGIISVEHIYDEQALATGRRVRNPKVSDDRVQELVRKGVIKEPRLDQPFTEVTIEESPVITIRDARYRIKAEDVEIGTLSGLENFSPPKTFTGWTSAVTGQKDTTGIAAKVAGTGGPKAGKQKPPVEAAPGRRLVQTKEGAARYGVPIGSPIPESTEEAGTENIVTMTREHIHSDIEIPEITEFYNTCHAKDGKFCPTSGGKGGPGPSGKSILDRGKGSKGSGKAVSDDRAWPSRGGRKVTTVATAGRFGTVKVDGIKAKAVYEVSTSTGKNIRLYDQSGKAGKFKDSMLNNSARMHEMYPLRPPRNIVVVEPNTMERIAGDKVTNAIVNHGDPHTYYNSDRLGMDVGRFSDGFLMPSSKTGNTKNMDYILTHEYGHQLDFDRNVTGNTHKANALTRVPGFSDSVSKYGKVNNIEVYAETFAEYHHSNGQTRNPAAQAMARSEGWYGSGVSASSGTESFDSDTPWYLRFTDPVEFAEKEDDSDDLEVLVKKIRIAVADNFEKGAKIIGDVKTKEPTEAEVAKAQKIWDELKEGK